MNPTDFSPLPFASRDLELLSVNALSEHLRASRAFVRLCLCAGCPSRGGRLSAAELLHWLFEHYAEVREIAGLKPLPEVEIAHPSAMRFKMAYAVITLTQFGISRGSVLREKRQMRVIIRLLESTLKNL